jgi:hypothetical protein
MDNTGIDWCDATWNPVTGCTKVSPGCDHCYAAGIAHRFAGTPAYPNGFAVTLRPERLDQPTRWRRPRRIFVNSMTDLFHADVPDDYIADVFGVMSSCACPSRCGRNRVTGQLLCRPCWGDVPRHLQREVHRTWRAWRADLGDPDLMRSHRSASDAAIASVR